MSIGRTLRGIRDRIPPGYVLGRIKPGLGPVELIRVPGLSQPPGLGGASNISTGADLEFATPTEQLTGTEAAKASTPDSVAALWEKGGDITSAGTISIGEGGYFHVTGTVTITDIDFATTKSGRAVILEFDGSLLLTYNATTLILPTAADITTAAGDTCLVVSEGGDNVRVAWYQRADGSALVGTAGTEASTTEILTGTNTTKFGSPNSIAALWEKGADEASGATVSLGEGGFFHITGTTTITDIDFDTDKSGRKAILVFDDVLTLTHNATSLILPTGANITTAAGDTCCVVSEDGSNNVRVVWYQRKDGTALAGGSGTSPYQLINRTTTASSQTSITWSSLGGYHSVEIRGLARGLDAGADVALELQFNGDTGTNYGYAQLFFQNNTSNVQNNSGQSSILGPQIPAAGSTSGYAGAFVIEIEHITSTILHKHVLGRVAQHRTGTGQRGMNTAGQWFDTSAITSIKLFVASGFLDGCDIEIWGRT